MQFKVISIGKALVTSFARQEFVTGVQLLDVDSQIGFTATSGRTEFAFKDWFVSTMNESVGLKRVALCEPGVTYIALVWLLTRMYSEMSFKFVSVGTGVRAVRTLIGTFSSMASHMTLEFRQLDGRIIAFRTSVWLFVCMSVPDVSDQFARCGERRVTVFTAVRSDTSVGIDVIL